MDFFAPTVPEADLVFTSSNLKFNRTKFTDPRPFCHQQIDHAFSLIRDNNRPPKVQLPPPRPRPSSYQISAALIWPPNGPRPLVWQD